MNVLLIGGSGYIGSSAAYYLCEKGHDVSVFDKKEYSGPATYFPYDIENFKRFDITKNSLLVAAMMNADCIVMLAGLVGDLACEKNPSKANILNNTVVENICRLIGDKQIILFSSCSVYGAQDDILNEDSSTNPISVYAKTKVAAEWHVLSVGGLVFRLGSVYGVGYTDTVRMEGIVNFLVKQAIYSFNGEITIMGGSQWKSLISVYDVVHLLEEAIRENRRGLFNITDKSYTVKNIGKEIIKCFPGTKIKYVAALPNDRNYRINNSKMFANFKYWPESTLHDEIIKLAKYFKQQLKGKNNV
jgi:nucleoside-diphosphate-sugar epimerase